MTFQMFWSSIFLVFSFAGVNYVESQRAPEGCYGVMDVIVAVDGSDSINLRDYKKLRKSMETFVEELDISKDAIHLAFVVYSSTIADETDLSYDKAYLKHFASGLIHPRRATNTHLALEEMRLIHERKTRKDVPSVGLLFTDGISKNKTKTLEQAKLLRDAGIVLYAVGISNILDFSELRSIAPNRTLKFDSYKQLLDHIKAFVKYICQKCDSPPPIRNAISPRGEFIIGSLANYKCRIGYFQTGTPTIKCLTDKRWGPTDFACRRNCQIPMNIQYATVTYDGTLEGDTAKYTCKAGTEPDGDNTIICQGNGRWSRTAFRCRVNCGTPRPIPRAILLGPMSIEGQIVSVGTYVGDEREYKCEPNTVMQGNPRIQCQRDGSWSKTDLKCLPNCGNPKTIPGTTYTLLKGVTTEGASAEYRCLQGIKGRGTPTITCQANGKWTTTNFRCIPDCGEPTEKDGADVDDGDSTEGSIRRYTCRKNYDGTGSPEIECLKSGDWSKSDFNCRRNCGKPPYIPGAELDVGGTLEGDTRKYICGKRFYPKGDNDKITCQGDGEWSECDLKCIPNCFDPPSIIGAYVNEGGTLEGDERVYTCDDVYQGIGSPNIWCQENGQWSNLELQCIPNCFDPPSIYGAEISGGGTLYGDERTYVCGEKYHSKGNPKVTCQENRKWSASDFKCIPNCGTPPDIQGTDVMYSGTLVADRATYVCPQSTVQEGEMSIECQKNGEWSHSNFYCRPKCGEPPHVIGAKVQDGGILEGDERTYRCEETRHTEGNPKIICQKNGEWSDPDIKCIPKCGIPPNKPGTEIEYTGTVQGDRATYVCPSTSVAEGETTIICQDDGQWTHTDIYCKAKCEEPPFVYGATIDEGGSLEGDERIYTCGETYYEKGNSHIRCQNDGHWSRPKVECIPNCGVPRPIAGTIVEYTGTLKDDQATYLCPLKTVPEGETTITCQDDGHWSNTDINCRPKCDEPPVVYGAKVSDGESLEGDERIYTCGEMYYQKGNSKIWCQDDGEWSKPEVECIPNCGIPNDKPGMEVQYSRTLKGDHATYVCPSTSVAEGETTIICQDNGQWSQTNIQCRPKCDEPPVVYGASVSDGESLEGDERIYTCGEMYFQKGNSKIWCQDDGEWSKPEVECILNCGIPKDKPGTEVQYSGTLKGDHATYVCPSTSVAEGETTIICQDNGQWSHTNIHCRPNCEEPPSIHGATVSDGDSLEGDERVYTCGDKYYAKGNSKIWCQEDGKWSRPELECIPNCGKPRDISGAKVHYTGTLVGDRATYICPATTETEGENMIICQENGEWSQSNIYCRPNCDEPPSVYGATVSDGDSLEGDERAYTCGDIYHAEGDNKVVCQDNGEWSQPNIKCIPNCFEPPSIFGAEVSEGGTLHGDERVYTCGEKYYAKDNSKIKCQENGKWSETTLKCIPNCGDPPRVFNTEVTYTGTLQGDEATYTCPQTTVAEGEDTIVCQDNGKWTDTNINCRMICDKLPSIKGATVGGGGNLHGDERIFTCGDIYYAEGDPKTVCQENGKWTVPNLTCIPNCYDPPFITRAIVSDGGSLYGDEREYTCEEKHHATGNPKIRCQETGKWSSSDFECIPDCGEPPYVQDTEMLYTGTLRGDTLTYVCPPTTVPEGQLTIKCLDNGEWSQTKITCRPNCSDPPLIYGASVNQGGTLQGDERVYNCKENYQSKGNPMIICQKDGHWSASGIECRRICEVPMNIPFASVKYSGTLEGDKAAYTCDKGRKPEGNNVIECQKDGSWSKTGFKCKVECAAPKSVLHAKLVDNEDTFTIEGMTVQPKSYEADERLYECVPGTVMEGDPKIRCQADGSWTATYFYCRPNCYEPPQVDGASVSLGGTMEGDQRTYVCDEGFTSWGNGTVVCQENGHWSECNLKCIPKCRSPPAIPGTSIEITGAEVGSTGVYTCLDNTVAEGNAKIICQENSQWSISDIRCRRDCGNPPAVPFTTISSGGTLQRDERTYSCSNNMTPVGNTTIRCQDNGRWSQIEFHCRRSCKPGSYNCRVTEYGNRPPTNDYGNRPPSNNYGNRPPTNDYGNRPPTNDYGNRPPSNDYGNRPKTNDYGNRPPTNDYGNRQPSNDNGNRPPTNDYGNRPSSNDNGNRPPTNTYGNRPPTNDYGNRPPTNDYGNRQAIGSGNKQTNDNGKRQTINSENNLNRIPNSNIDLLRRRLTGRTGYAPPKTVVRENRYDSGTQSGESSAVNEGHIASSETPVNKNNYNDVKQVIKRKSTKQNNNKIKQSGDKSKVDTRLNPRLAFLKRRKNYVKSDRSKLKSFFRKYMNKALSRRKKPTSSD